MSSKNKELDSPKHIVIGEGLAPPAMILIGAGSRTERYLLWLSQKFEKASVSPENTRSRHFMKICCQLAVLSIEHKATWTFKQRQGRSDETDLEKVLKDFIESKLELLKQSAPYLGVSWPKEKTNT